MKAAQVSEYGGADAVKVVDADKPATGEGRVLVEVYAASLNPFDIKVRQGSLKKLHLPVTLGGDIAGIVREVGPNVSDIQVGDEVYGQANAAAGDSGAFAEYAVTRATQLAKKPSSASFVEAAALPLTGVSALQVISKQLKLQPGQKILIHGGAGGIGTIAIQVAKHIGAYVATTATGDGIAYVRDLGANEVIDYMAERFEGKLHDFDAVFDTIGGDTYERSFKVLKQGGTIVSMLMSPDADLMEQYGVTAILQMTRANTEDLTALARMVEQGGVKPHVDKIFSLADAAEAFTAWESGRVKGKVVLQVRQD